MCLSCTVMEIWRLKDNGVTSLTFWGHVTSSGTKEKWKKKRKGRGREGKKKVEGEKEGKVEGDKERKLKGREWK